MEKEIPSSILYGSIAGLVLLGISVILFSVYMIVFNEAYDTNVTLTAPNFTPSEMGLFISYIATGVTGFFLCFLIPYAHHLKSLNDPSVVSSKNGLHLETADDNNRLEAEDIVKQNSYNNSNILPSSSSFSSSKRSAFL